MDRRSFIKAIPAIGAALVAVKSVDFVPTPLFEQFKRSYPMGPVIPGQPLATNTITGEKFYMHGLLNYIQED